MKILDVGSGTIPKLISDYVEIDIIYADKQLTPAEDMENLTYADKSFDLVICINALDHTKDAKKALEEMLRVGRMVYIHCVEDQKSKSKKHHYWDAKFDGSFTNGKESFNLRDYGFEVEYIVKPPGKGEYGQVIGICYQ